MKPQDILLFTISSIPLKVSKIILLELFIMFASQVYIHFSITNLVFILKYYLFESILMRLNWDGSFFFGNVQQDTYQEINTCYFNVHLWLNYCFPRVALLSTMKFVRVCTNMNRNLLDQNKEDKIDIVLRE